MEDSQITRTQDRVVVVASLKNPGLAAGLAFFFGPIGLLYSSIPGSIVMFIVNFAVGLVTLGFGLFLTWPLCAVWGYIAAQKYNTRLQQSAGLRTL